MTAALVSGFLYMNQCIETHTRCQTLFTHCPGSLPRSTRGDRTRCPADAEWRRQGGRRCTWQRATTRGTRSRSVRAHRNGLKPPRTDGALWRCGVPESRISSANRGASRVGPSRSPASGPDTGAERSRSEAFTAADMESIDDDIDSDLADAGVPLRPRGFARFIRSPGDLECCQEPECTD